MATSSFTTKFQFTKENASDLLNAIDSSRHIDITMKHKVNYWTKEDVKKNKDSLKQVFK